MNKIFEAYARDNPVTESGGWIQWKGTDVCIDLHCICGQTGHIDGMFMYQLLCSRCNRKYLVGQNIKLIELTLDESNDEYHEAYIIED